MSLPALIQAQNLIKAGDIVGAESALATLAETEGDQALVVALDQFPAKDLLAIIREYDCSKESLVNLLVTPAQFAQAVVLEKRYADLSHEQLRGMINSVIFREDADPSEFLYAISEVDGGYDALADYLAERTERIEFFYRYATFDLFEYSDEVKTQAIDDDLLNLTRESEPQSSPLDMSNVEDHDWMEVTTILRYQHPDIFREVLLKLRARLKKENAQHDAFMENMGELPEGVLDNDKPMPSTERPDFEGLQEESAL
ncbi:hypothetical protein [Solimicrobium silvestre]|uniref:Uncharacterized protein n=1 Tax=Solimicrobium silvestre TaxID=2099400 RepID=A0A2S9GVA9_9BURK|nr:hypothetical protein [Solimicrobium silvestre]PRC91596.1 hypothetical protein S2091_3712 [Solimicrobium silvestre]